LPGGARQAPAFLRSGGLRKGRDGARVPLPWTRELPARSWLPQPGWWRELSVETEQRDDHSILTLFRRALALRPSGGFTWREAPAGGRARGPPRAHSLGHRSRRRVPPGDRPRPPP